MARDWTPHDHALLTAMVRDSSCTIEEAMVTFGRSRKSVETRVRKKVFATHAAKTKFLGCNRTWVHK